MMLLRHYHLFLTEDKRLTLDEDSQLNVLYNRFIGTEFKKKQFYRYRVSLWDRFANKYLKETVWLKVVKEKGNILIVEVSNASI